jgi:hypothetical protein
MTDMISGYLVSVVNADLSPRREYVCDASSGGDGRKDLLTLFQSRSNNRESPPRVGSHRISMLRECVPTSLRSRQWCQQHRTPVSLFLPVRVSSSRCYTPQKVELIPCLHIGGGRDGEDANPVPSNSCGEIGETGVHLQSCTIPRGDDVCGHVVSLDTQSLVRALWA